MLLEQSVERCRAVSRWIKLGLSTPAFQGISPPATKGCAARNKAAMSRNSYRRYWQQKSMSYLVYRWAKRLVRASLQQFWREKGKEGINVLWQVRNVLILGDRRGTGHTIQWAVWHLLTSVNWFLWNVTYFLVAQERKEEKIKAV